MPTIPIFKMFGRSPISPLQKHMKKAHRCVRELKPFFKAVIASDWKSAEVALNRIRELEHEADKLKRTLRLNLPKGLFLPVPRTVILELAYKQDALANKTQDIAGLVFGRKMHIPEPIQKTFMKLLDRCIAASQQADKAICELNELLEAGFSGTERSIVASMIDKLFKIEDETDVLQIQTRREIFDIEKDLPPIDAIFLYKVIERTGMLANLAQHVGDHLQLLITR